MNENELRQMAPDPDPMKSANHALEELRRKQAIERCEEARRAHEMGYPPPAPSRQPSLIDKVRLLYRIRTLIKQAPMKSWKTTLGGLLIAAGQAVPSILPPAWHWLQGTLTGVGALVMGAAAQDSSSK